jgi:hypothetical protein
MLFQSNARYSKNIDLLFLLFNQLQRHASSRSVTFKVQTGQENVQEFLNKVKVTTFNDELDVAIADPKSASSKKLAKQLLRMTQPIGAKIPWSPMERTSYDINHNSHDSILRHSCILHHSFFSGQRFQTVVLTYGTKNRQGKQCPL